MDRIKCILYEMLMFVFFHIDECCVHIEVYYQTLNEAYDNQSHVYGIYTKMSGSVNGRSHYQSDFDNGAFGIWWCSSLSTNAWMISESSYHGQCTGYAAAAEDVKCPENVGWNWFYTDNQGWFAAEEGLGVYCTGTSVTYNFQSLI